VGCGPVGGLPTYDPFQQSTGFPGATPYRQPAPMQNPQTVSQPTVRQVTSLPRPPIDPTKLSQAAAAEQAAPVQTSMMTVEVPSPQQLGIRLDDRTATHIVVPEPEKLGIKVE
jgi:hypothetical protein